MTTEDMATDVLEHIGGPDNLVSNMLCMTRLRLAVADPSLIDREGLVSIPGVLGVVGRGANGIEVVFGPNKVEAVHHALCRLLGVDPYSTRDATQRPPEPARRLNVQVLRGGETPAAAGTSPAYESAAPAGAGGDEVMELARLLRRSEKDAAAPADGSLGAPDEAPTAPGAQGGAGLGLGRLLVINGPSINMLGIREPGIYGSQDFATLLDLCRRTAADLGFEDCVCYQSNHEGDLVDAIQDAYGTYAGIILNPGAYTHTSIALLDALRAVGIPAIEVHISKLDAREEFRQVSYVRKACLETVMGMGIQGYAKAMRDLASHLRRQGEA
ncbi:type II 3-dehydroquinate dehydratase [Olsenella sp. HMSC062G07]|uniref:type II 3-dehydroquinate dehydratase n=1 Tax=Olsenella sp. HMSC062G07 TaxID=1739330 RepID=UPI0008A51913|nr:type II 3-dehydroquinate dehydratase [Olsenella sp. HMSC062G07]OFK24325.1 hypothetical protein HMPREF2826_07790 [Olsenella sp. HMSC062G07]